MQGHFEPYPVHLDADGAGAQSVHLHSGGGSAHAPALRGLSGRYGPHEVRSRGRPQALRAAGPGPAAGAGRARRRCQSLEGREAQDFPGPDGAGQGRKENEVRRIFNGKNHGQERTDQAGHDGDREHHRLEPGRQDPHRRRHRDGRRILDEALPHQGVGGADQGRLRQRRRSDPAARLFILRGHDRRGGDLWQGHSAPDARRRHG